MLRFLRKWWDVIILAVFLLVFLLLRFYLFPWFTVKQTSMLETLHNGDVVVVSHIYAVRKDFKRGDIVVFYLSDKENKNGEYLVKRIIGLPGEIVEIHNGTVYINGSPIEEPYVTYKGSSNFGPYKVPSGKVFVLGDNRPASRDSRFFGAIDESSIVGRVILRIYPFYNFKIFRRISYNNVSS